ncbi:fumarate reductase subunit C [Corallincola holothuriorum]|uniref:Fumarate reductase subunit C n=1 Tax=Corallincola holothuriorum TaxID=2282215 RepID=A0A368NMU1_9GAMM|nr:fumarate reductase subunit C [Corallincola holothuriorum]RCU51466.1 fumarate reductase subunit C [Corallincola holothuriorum]
MSKRKPYTRPMGPTWWASHPYYRFYMLREGTSVFVTLYTLALVCALFALVKGEAAWDAYVSAMSSPAAIVFHLVCLAMAMLHAVTWFSLTPKTMDIWIKGKPLPENLIVGGHYAGFVVASIVVIVAIGGWL